MHMWELVNLLRESLMSTDTTIAFSDPTFKNTVKEEKRSIPVNTVLKNKKKLIAKRLRC